MLMVNYKKNNFFILFIFSVFCIKSALFGMEHTPAHGQTFLTKGQFLTSITHLPILPDLTDLVDATQTLPSGKVSSCKVFVFKGQGPTLQEDTIKQQSIPDVQEDAIKQQSILDVQTVNKLLIMLKKEINKLITNQRPLYGTFNITNLFCTKEFQWCLVHPDACPTPTQRIELIIRQVNAIAKAYPNKEEPLVHCTVAEESFLQTYLLIKALEFVGYKNLVLVVIGKDVASTAEIISEQLNKKLIKNKKNPELDMFVTVNIFQSQTAFEQQIKQDRKANDLYLTCHSYDMIDPGAGTGTYKQFNADFVNKTKAIDNPIIFTLIDQIDGIWQHFVVPASPEAIAIVALPPEKTDPLDELKKKLEQVKTNLEHLRENLNKLKYAIEALKQKLLTLF